MEKLPRLIGVCLSTIHDEDRFNFIKVLNEKAVDRGFRLLIFNSGSDLYEQNNADNEGASSVFRLIPYEKLSAMIVFPSFIYNESVICNITKNCRKLRIPVIAIDKNIPDCISFSFKYADVFEKLCRHVIEDHGARKLFLLTGFEGNDFSEERTAAFRKALESNGIPFEKNNVGYGCFWDGPTTDVLLTWFEIEKREIPDAIICANDSMAITASSFLQKRGYTIPDDCIITGFDGIEQSKFHMPHLTTCKQDYDKMSNMIMDVIGAFERGEEISDSYTVGFNIIYGQSCGCRSVSDTNVNLAIQTMIDRMRLSAERQNMMCSLQSSISKMSDIGELPQILIDKFRFHTTVFAVNDDIFDAPDFGSNHKGENSFSENIKILHQRYFWYDLEKCHFPTSELIPRYDLLARRTDPIIVCTAHFIDMVLGYCIFQPDIDIDEYQKMHTFMSAIGAALGNFHGRIQIRSINEKLLSANNELHMLSQRDFMTGLFNRRGFFDNFEKLMKKDDILDSTVIIISADLDELKYINDNYGHIEGDNAINTVSRALVSSSVKGEICARFGGDEFCVAAVVPAQESGYYFNDFKERFLDYLYDYNRKSDKPYTIKASIGCCIEKSCDGCDPEEMIRIADEHMYADKVRHKRQK